MATVEADRLVWTPALLAARIQHTLIRTDATHDEVVRHCRECLEYGFDAAMVGGDWLPLVRRELAGSPVKVASALDFPVALMTTAGRVEEARALVEAGADEIDVGCKIGWLKSGSDRAFLEDLEAVVRAARPARVKLMLELPLLEPGERERAVALAVRGRRRLREERELRRGRPRDSRPDPLPALPVPAEIGVKASGGIDTHDGAIALLDAGADLLGSSRGAAVL